MSTTASAPPPELAERPGMLDRLLGGIERVGNKVPHPAIMFLALCIGVIVLSQLMAWAGVGATYEVVKPPDQSVEAIDVGGSTLPAEVMPSEPPDASDYEVVTRDGRDREPARPPTASASCSPRSCPTSWASRRWGSS